MKQKRPRKNNILFLTIVAVTLAGAVSPCFAQAEKLPIRVTATVDKKTVTIGDKIKYSIRITKEKGLEIELPQFGQNLGNFAIKDFGLKKSGWFGQEKILAWYLLDTYGTGKAVMIPKATIKYRRPGEREWQEIETDEQSIEVKSILAKAGPGARMRDIKAPLNLPSKMSWFFIGALLILIAAGAGFLVYFFQRKTAQEGLRCRPAYEIANEELAELERKNYLTQGKIKEYYVEISGIVRHYLENRFNLRAPEMTTEEFLANVRDSAELVRAYKDLLREFLTCCDMVKFARYAPQEEEIRSVFTSAKNFIDQTKEAPLGEEPQGTIPK